MIFLRGRPLVGISLQVLRSHPVLLHIWIYVFFVIDLFEIFEKGIALFGHAQAR